MQFSKPYCVDIVGHRSREKQIYQGRHKGCE
jgi:hypothetical protein